jgi:hypothetical protein
MGGALMEPRSTPRCGSRNTGQTRPPAPTRCGQLASLHASPWVCVPCCEVATVAHWRVWLEEAGGVASRRVAPGVGNIPHSLLGFR